MNCRYCDTVLLKPFLELGSMALANSFINLEDAKKDEFQCPLSLTRCSRCGLIQLTHVVPADLMFSNYLYVSSTTQTFKTHFAEYAKSAKAKLFKKEGGIAVDIGSNDGLLLSCYQNVGLRAVGVEPAKNLSEDANRRGITTVNDYWGEAAVSRILSEWGPADIISGNNVFAHIDDIQAVLRNVDTLLDDKGIFVIEFPYLVTMCEKMLFDMIYHEHLSYIAVTPLKYVLSRFNLEIFTIEQVASHGGSLRVFIQKKGAGRTISPEVESLLQLEAKGGYNENPAYEKFAKEVYQVKESLIQFVNQAQAEGKTISGYGAAAKASTIANFCAFNPSQIDYIVDDNPLKQNKLMPGAKIPVVPNSHLTAHPTDYVIIFAWNFASEIIKKLESLKQKGIKFIIPLPKPHIV